jgi:hypothetical protein
MKQLSRGVVKSIPLGGALLEQVIYGTLDGEAAQKEAAKLRSVLFKISQEVEGQDATLGDVLGALENQVKFSQEIAVEMDKFTALLKDPDHAPIPERLGRALERVIQQNDEQTETFTGEMNEIKALLDRLIEKTDKAFFRLSDTGIESRRAYKVFVSSTYLDNRERRKTVQDAITMAGMVWHGMEIFAASTRPAVEECLRLAKEADLLVGIVAWRYGWEPDSKKSITEMEYDDNSERLMFQLDPSLPVNPEKDFDSGPERWKKQEKLDAFKKRFSQDQMLAYFNETSLGAKVLYALNEWLKRREPRSEPETDHRRAPDPKLDDDKRLLDEYLKDVVVATSRIDIQGIYSMSGSGRRLIYFPIEQHYTPLRTMRNPAGVEDIPTAVGAADTGAGRAPLTDLLSSHRRLLIIGDPGGGKTTFLRLIACVLAKDALGQDEPCRKLYLGLSLEKPPLVPILIRLSVLAGRLKDGCALINGAGLWRVLLETMEELFGKQKAAMLQRLLDHGRCVLLLDGLDEEPDLNLRKQIVDVTNAVLHHWGRNLIVLSSRPFGYHAVSALEEMVTAHIDAFGKEEILEFLYRWARALFPDEEERNREAYLPELESAILNIPPIRRMARNPVMLTCLCVVHWNEKKLPEGKADLLAAVLRWLLNAREDKRKARGYGNTFAEECFKALGLAMTDYPKGKQVNADLAWAAEQLEVPFRDELGVERARLLRKGMDFLEAEMLDSGIVEQAVTGQLRFWHYTFQEHYAARALVELSDGDGSEGWWHAVAPHLDDRQWDEVLDHFAGCLARTGRMRLNFLVERVLGTAMKGDLASVARAVGILGRTLRILEVYDYQPPARLGWEEARKQVMDIFTPEGALRVPVEQRIVAAEALGQAGDPRFKPLAPEMLPISGLPDVLLAKYPVTVCEYQRFVENKGYEDPEYWEEWWSTKEDRGWSEPGQWDEQKEHLNRPVTGVSWYEAAAFCNWLAMQTGLAFRLPKSEEWGNAAANPNGDYPWGKDDPNQELCNFDFNVGNPTPVGIYPAGAAPGGHLDMAGNVLEWTEDLFREGGSSRVVRGGYWSNVARHCRSALRYGDSPDGRSIDLGFRLSRSLP